MSDEEVPDPEEQEPEASDAPESEESASEEAAPEGAAPDSGDAVATTDAPGDVQLYEQGFQPADPVKDRLLLPLLLPLLSMAAIFVFVLNLSRVFLAAGNGPEAWIIAGIVTLVILIGAAAISASPQLRSSTLVLTVATFLVVIGGAGLIALGPSEPASEHGGGFQEPTGDPVATLEVDARGNNTFQADEFSVASGIIEINYVGIGGTHTLAFEESEFAGFELAVSQGETDTGKIELAAGEYTIHCTIPGHDVTMHATLTVTEGAAPPPDSGAGEPDAGGAGSSTTTGASTTTAP
jgi:plastocyanin